MVATTIVSTQPRDKNRTPNFSQMGQEPQLKSYIQKAPLFDGILTYMDGVLFDACIRWWMQSVPAMACFDTSLQEEFLLEIAGIYWYRIFDDLVYNDAPWKKNNTIVEKHFVHPGISNELLAFYGDDDSLLFDLL